jgi:hypothetical protein
MRDDIGAIDKNGVRCTIKDEMKLRLRMRFAKPAQNFVFVGAHAIHSSFEEQTRIHRNP